MTCPQWLIYLPNKLRSQKYQYFQRNIDLGQTLEPTAYLLMRSRPSPQPKPPINNRDWRWYKPNKLWLLKEAKASVSQISNPLLQHHDINLVEAWNLTEFHILTNKPEE